MRRGSARSCWPRSADGKAVALASDAGTPLVSDPGYRLALEARAAGHPVVPVPGASAVLAALVASGLPSDAFMFAGFMPVKPGAVPSGSTELKMVPATLIFFESPKRLAASLAAMADAFGGARPAAVARELTKIHESVRRGTLAELAAAYGAEAPPKGEIVVVVGPPSVEETSAEDADQVSMSLLETRSVSARRRPRRRRSPVSPAASSTPAPWR